MFLSFLVENSENPAVRIPSTNIAPETNGSSARKVLTSNTPQKLSVHAGIESLLKKKETVPSSLILYEIAGS